MAEDISLLFTGEVLAAPDEALSSEEAELVRRKLVTLLAKRTSLYTALDSSSVPVETAQELMTSLTFTLGLALCASGGAARRMVTEDLDALFRQGVQNLKERLEWAKQLYETAYLGLPAVENVSLRDSTRGIGIFFRRYDLHFFAHQIPAVIDYQLCRTVPDHYLGIEYVVEYLRRLIMENDFLRHFEPEQVARLLMGWCPHYRDLPVNLFEPVAANAVGRALLKVPLSLDSTGRVQWLSVTDEDRELLAALFENLPEPGARSALREAAARLCRTLEIRDPAAREYLENTASDLYPRIAAVLPYGGLAGIFPSLAPGEIGRGEVRG
jgi:hypothetical protein